MDKKLKAKWVKALRSGKYRQARRTLLTPRGYCCLGVLARISRPDARRCDLDYPGFSVLKRNEQLALANRNDGTNGFEPHSFREIADYIAKNL